MSGNYAYVADWYDGVRVIDVSNPASTSEIGYYDVPGHVAISVHLSGNLLYVALYSGGLRIVDVSNPALPVEIGVYTSSSPTFFARHVELEGNHVWMADDSALVRTIDVSVPSTPVEVSAWDVSCTTWGVDAVWDHAYLANTWDGLHILDISDPNAPTRVGTVDTSNANDVVVEGSYAYLADGWSGFKVIDVGTPTNPVEVGSLDLGIRCENIDVQGQYAYVGGYPGSGANPELNIVDVSSPGAPVVVSSVALPGGQCRDVVVQGDYAYLAAYSDGLIIVDVSDPTTPVQVGSIDVGSGHGVAVQGDHVYLAAGGNGLKVFDVSTPSAPVHVGSSGTPGSAWGIDVSGDLVYVAIYTAGMCIFDVSDPTDPQQVGVYDTGDHARKLVVRHGHAHVADSLDGLWILESTELPCGVVHDGESEEQAGLSVAGDVCYGVYYECLGMVHSIEVAYGDPGASGSIANGSPVTLGIWDDPTDDADPVDAVLIAKIPIPGGVTNAETGIMNVYDMRMLVGAPVPVSGGSFAAAVVTQLYGEYPCPMDMNDPDPGVNWVAGQGASTGLPFDYHDLVGGNSFPAGLVEDVFMPCDWLVTVNGQDPGGEPGICYCSGDVGDGTPCPCSNDNDGSVPCSGCDNGSYASGAKLTASGNASVSNDTLVLHASHLEPSNSGLYFQANNDRSPGVLWGDGLSCAGGALKRLQLRFADPTGSSFTTIGISAKAGNISAGDTKFYQIWYRDPAGSPCGYEFNASNGYAIFWGP